MADANRPLKTSKEGAFIARACIPLCLSSLPAPPKFNNFAPNIVHPQNTTTFVINDDTENPPHFIHEIKTKSYDIIDVNVMLLLGRFLPKERLIRCALYYFSNRIKA